MIDPLANVITPQSALSRPDRSFRIVTTASLWFTGTAVYLLLRAAHLYQHQTTAKTNYNKNKYTVILVVPWLEEADDQEKLCGRAFWDYHEQEDCIRGFLSKQASMEEASQGLQIRWYPARYHAGLGLFSLWGIFSNAAREICWMFCLLEEPEHW